MKTSQIMKNIKNKQNTIRIEMIYEYWRRKNSDELFLGRNENQLKGDGMEPYRKVRAERWICNGCWFRNGKLSRLRVSLFPRRIQIQRRESGSEISLIAFETCLVGSRLYCSRWSLVLTYPKYPSFLISFSNLTSGACAKLKYI